MPSWMLTAHAGGLSPRVRGNHDDDDLTAYQKGSIPACAGEPPASRCKPGAAEVYPRVCGGTTGTHFGTHWYAGLSPRVRGNPTPKRVQRSETRSIPACAGEPV